MRWRWSLMLAVLAGCAAPPTADPPDMDPWAEYTLCHGTFPDGMAVTCAQGAEVVEPEPAVPLGWIPLDRAHSNSFDEWQPYADANNPGRVGLWFRATPRLEGDFESPHPTQYGGLLRAGPGPAVAWQTTSNEGFVRSPAQSAPLRGPWAVTVYVPIVNDLGVDQRHANATLMPWWNLGATLQAANALLQVSDQAREYFFHGGLPGVGASGYGVIKPGDFEMHLYVLLGEVWQGS